jgi:CubicO group peptidase (beta-lactamase class C family)
MTATLMATLIEDGLLDWDSTLDVPPRGRFDTGSTITLHQLLSHTAGVPVFGLPHWLAMPEFEGDIVRQRQAFTDWQLTLVGNKNEYSNAGYAMAAHMGESVTGQPWETLIAERLFAPLGVNGVFGWPAKHDPNQPWGHWPENLEDTEDPEATVVPHDPADEYKVPQIIAPAGDVSMTMPDVLVFLRENLRGLNAQSDLLTHESFEVLHAVVAPAGSVEYIGSDYACGWMILPEAYGGLTLHMHTGSALTFFFEMVVVPERDFAVAVGANAYSLGAAYACDVTLVSLLDLHLEALAKREAGDPDGPVENATIGVRYATIQAAVDLAEEGEVIVIDPGTYEETVNLTGKDIVLRGAGWDVPSAAADTVLRGDGTQPVVFLSGNGNRFVVEGLTLTGGSVGARVEASGARLVGCHVTGNRGAGIEAVDEAAPALRRCVVAGNGAQGITLPPRTVGRKPVHSSADVVNCTLVQNAQEAISGGRLRVVSSILYDNGGAAGTAQLAPHSAEVTYCNVQGGFAGTGNIDADPAFARLGYWGHARNTAVVVEADDPHAVWIPGDCHLVSQAGRWDPAVGEWVTDDVTSPCIDAGDPASAVGLEPSPNGGRINLGAYGGTGEASKSPVATAEHVDLD